MAAGDIFTYPQFRLGQLLHTTNIGDRDLTDTNVKLAVMKNTWTPSTNYTTDDFLSDMPLATYQVATGTGYTGPITLTTPTAVLNASNLPEFRADDITIPVDASGFTDGRWWIVYYDNASVEATSPVICYGDFGADKSIQTSSLQIDFSNVGDAVNTLMRW